VQIRTIEELPLNGFEVQLHNRTLLKPTMLEQILIKLQLHERLIEQPPHYDNHERHMSLFSQFLTSNKKEKIALKKEEKKTLTFSVLLSND
jgi:hypothetical protein